MPLPLSRVRARPFHIYPVRQVTGKLISCCPSVFPAILPPMQSPTGKLLPPVAAPLGCPLRSLPRLFARHSAVPPRFFACHLHGPAASLLLPGFFNPPSFFSPPPPEMKKIPRT